MEARFAIFENTLTGPNYRVGNFRFCEKKLRILSRIANLASKYGCSNPCSFRDMFSKIFFEKITKTSYLENYKDLNCHIWRQGLQLLRVLWQHPTTRLRISNFEKQLIKIFWKFLKKSQKTSYLENYKELSSHIWRQDSQSVKVLWQHPTTRLGISNFERKIIKIFWNFLKKSQKDISKTTRIWAFIFGGKIRNLWEHSDRTQLQGWELQILWKKNKNTQGLRILPPNMAAQILVVFEICF